MVAQKGDYIIKGVQGEFYPCKPDIFTETYEVVSEA
ncbi:prophage Lp2 protein 33 [Streptococcus pneumoniae]|nr:prophage Lp2 protein 33 [Streptococcus pneumoniae]VND72313.1 prophage Lp2 protein 33 [Streptococcus pneumoniae]VOM59604.1 prophage Lp2 protein 33 [Streptococcus pneumoniae]VON29633.1 prophage Lp2 protein 33 [Streptococcus pneumoniae]VON79825.1 prophage Lp2 protein 33 [Streptococcus pneumoniae]